MEKHEQEINMLTIEYLKWAYPEKSNATGDASVIEFLRLYNSCKIEIEKLYPTLISNN